MILSGIVKSSDIGGRGVFASRKFKRGEVLCRMLGEPITIDELERRFKQGSHRITCDPLAVAEHEYLSLKEPYLFINHSCEPNTAIMGRDTLVAMREIDEGEELTYDYSAVEWTPKEYTAYDYSLWPMQCNCQTPSCRKVITCFPYLPASLRQHYLRQGMIQSYIARKVLGSRADQSCRACEHVLGVKSHHHFTDQEQKFARRILIKDAMRSNMKKLFNLIPR